MGIVKDLTGRKFGRLMVVSFVEINKHHQATWNVICDCGQKKIVIGSDMISGHTKSCGCYKDERVSERSVIDISGIRFGRATAICPTEKRYRGKVIWSAMCDCGNKFEVIASQLISGQAMSCGCLKNIVTSFRSRTHGLSRTSSYDKIIKLIKREKEYGLDTVWNIYMELELIKMFPTCPVCGSDRKVQTDHVYPLSLGNILKPGNAIRLCAHHNATKFTKTPEQLEKNFGGIILSSAEKFRVHWNSISGDNF